jgi:hypothetical protein
LAGYLAVNRQVVLHPPKPGGSEDVRAQAEYIAAHHKPEDVIVVTSGAQFGFAYYWNADRPEFVRGGKMATGWYIDFRPQDRITVVQQPDRAGISAALASARALAGSGRTWIVRSHVSAPEDAAWRDLLTGQPVERLPVGPEPLLVLGPAA